LNSPSYKILKSRDAVKAALQMQIELTSEAWGEAVIKVRMGIHTGEAELKEDGQYNGYMTLSRTQRLMSAGHGGQVLVSAATEKLALGSVPTGVLFNDLGERRLKDMPTPERIYQLAAEGLPSDFPPLNTLEGAPNNLPAALTSFVGRGKEIGEVKRLLENTHLLTLTGPGGTGKSRLALQTAGDLLNQFPHGVWLVELAPVTDPTQIGNAILFALNLPSESHRPAIDMLCDVLRERELLIILDNCEHLVEASSMVASRLLQASPRLRILATSREALGIAGESIFRVPSLDLPDMTMPCTLESLYQHEAALLFVERAAAALPTFSATNENASAIAQICSRLDGVPLALELAAAKVRALSVDQIAKRLDDRFRLLTGGNRTALERHQTLRATLDWSHNLLPEAEQTLFRRLSVFVNGWTLEAAEEVCSDEQLPQEDIFLHLEQLVNKSLVTADEWKAEKRYRMLETMRQYAGEKLIDVGKSTVLRDRHLDFFLTLAETAAPHLTRAEQVEWLDKLEEEHDNLRTALDWSSGFKNPQSILRLCAALGVFWVVHCHWMEGLNWLHIALAKPADNANEMERAARIRSLINDAELAQRLDDFVRMKQSLDAALTLCELGASRRDIAYAEFYLGQYLYFAELKTSKAREIFEKSLKKFQDENDLYGQAFARYFISDIYHSEEKTEWRQEAEKAHQLALQSGERLAIARTSDWLLGELWLEGQLDQAKVISRKIKAQYVELGFKIVSNFNSADGMIAHLEGNYELARMIYEKRIADYDALGEKNTRSFMCECLAILSRDEGDIDQACVHITEALAIARDLQFEYETSRRLAWLGQMEFLKGQVIKARQCFRDGLAMARNLNFTNAHSYPLIIFARTYLTMLPEGVTNIVASIHGYHDNVFKIKMDPFFLKREMDHILPHLRQHLDEATFNAVWEKGYVMTLHDAIDLALSLLEEEPS
jgi:predicted ATPase